MTPVEMPFHPIKPIRGGKPLGSVYRDLETSTEWMCQAKLNGKRAVWDPVTQRLWSRQGNVLHVEAAQMLSGTLTSLDGELMRDGRFWVYDVPDHAGQLSDRWPEVEKVVNEINQSLVRTCPLVTRWEEVTANGWEGVVFKKLTSKYRKGASEGRETTDWVKFRLEWL